MPFVDDPLYTPEQREGMRAWHAKIDAINAASRREVKRSQRKADLKGLWDMFLSLGMYSSDPTTARISMVYTAEKELAYQREMQEEQEQRRVAVAASMQADEEARRKDEMREMAEVMAKAFFDEAERRRTT